MIIPLVCRMESGFVCPTENLGSLEGQLPPTSDCANTGKCTKSCGNKTWCCLNKGLVDAPPQTQDVVPEKGPFGDCCSVP